jgi:hypothetical protein
MPEPGISSNHGDLEGQNPEQSRSKHDMKRGIVLETEIGDAEKGDCESDNDDRVADRPMCPGRRPGREEGKLQLAIAHRHERDLP